MVSPWLIAHTQTVKHPGETSILGIKGEIINHLIATLGYILRKYGESTEKTT
jgi:hypothetical protein